MGILAYQIVIALIIIISGYSGKKSLNTATIIIILFTITHVFMPWLMIVQFITIAISYSIIKNKAEIITYNKNNHKEEEISWGCTTFYIILLLFIIYIYVKACFFS